MTPPTSPQALARALLEAAEKATKGEWEVDDGNTLRPAQIVVRDIDADDRGRAVHYSTEIATMADTEDEEANAAYIALANPSNLTALVTWALETEARNAELEKALKPFVKVYDAREARYNKRGGNFDHLGDDVGVGDMPTGTFTHGDFRRARALLKGEK